jgi:hypothetical protein
MIITSTPDQSFGRYLLVICCASKSMYKFGRNAHSCARTQRAIFELKSFAPKLGSDYAHGSYKLSMASASRQVNQSLSDLMVFNGLFGARGSQMSCSNFDQLCMFPNPNRPNWKLHKMSVTVLCLNSWRSNMCSVCSCMVTHVCVYWQNFWT